MIRIREWDEIENVFEATLLLGNGASMALDSCFSYSSLLDQARRSGRITDNVGRIFTYLGSTDFELAMRMIRHAYHVNQALGVSEPLTDQAYSDIRKALVETVREVHPAHEEVATYLPAMGRFMSRFDTVLSLNYDLTVYWAMLEANRELGNWFKDGFLNGTFDDNWERLREAYQANGATLVFYPHGNIGLGTDFNGREFKLSVERDSERLLGAILRSWDEGVLLPLFVSEGDSAQKYAAINRSGYLGAVFNSVMTGRGESVVAYGCGFSDADEHILRRIAKARQIAVAVYLTGRDPKEVRKACSDLRWRIQQYNAGAIVTFFDSESAGCWSKA